MRASKQDFLQCLRRELHQGFGRGLLVQLKFISMSLCMTLSLLTDTNICRPKNPVPWSSNGHPNIVVCSTVDPRYSEGEDNRHEGQGSRSTICTSRRLNCRSIKMRSTSACSHAPYKKWRHPKEGIKSMYPSNSENTYNPYGGTYDQHSGPLWALPIRQGYEY